MSSPLLFEQRHCSNIFDAYCKTPYFFPLIGAVLENKQGGLVFANKQEKPTSFLIIHKFGFSQFFETKEDPDFETSISTFLSTDKLKKQHQIDKLRIHCTSQKWVSKLDSLAFDFAAKTKRCRFVYDSKKTKQEKGTQEYVPIFLTQANFKDINNAFALELDKRFWNNAATAIEQSKGVAVKKNREYASLCYAAAVSNHMAEIDIHTNDGFRKQGLAKMVVNSFIELCQKHGITPCWDCYRNNEASYNLACSTGFDNNFEYDIFILDYTQF